MGIANAKIFSMSDARNKNVKGNKMERILITGIAGLIGSHLLDKLLKRDYQVIGVDNLSFGKIENIQMHLQDDRFTFHIADVLDLEMMEQICDGVDTIIHLASIKKVHESASCMATLKVTGQGTENILEIAKRFGCKVVLASTSDVYGMSLDLPFKEEGNLLLGPSNIKRWGYAVAKLYSEQLAFAYYQDYSVPVVVLRYFGGFSERSCTCWSGGHVPIFIDAILNDQKVVIHGDGKQTRSMCYVDDLVKGTILAMENENVVGEVINIGSDEELSVLDTAMLIHRIADTGKKLRLKFVPLATVFGDYKEISRRKPDLTKARKLLGYKPTISLEDGLRKTIAGYNVHIESLGVDFFQPASIDNETDVLSEIDIQQNLLK
jgi:nucleoside-diphosphate-sugar epimerase